MDISNNLFVYMSTLFRNVFLLKKSQQQLLWSYSYEGEGCNTFFSWFTSLDYAHLSLDVMKLSSALLNIAWVMFGNYFSKTSK